VELPGFFINTRTLAPPSSPKHFFHLFKIFSRLFCAHLPHLSMIFFPYRLPFYGQGVMQFPTVFLFFSLFYLFYFPPFFFYAQIISRSPDDTLFFPPFFFPPPPPSCTFFCRSVSLLVTFCWSVFPTPLWFDTFVLRLPSPPQW